LHKLRPFNHQSWIRGLRKPSLGEVINNSFDQPARFYYSPVLMF
jgi:hypothetical protein